MKTLKTYAVLLCAALFLAGCYRNGQFYPVQGPLARQTPPPIFAARVSGAFFNGKVTVTLANGEICKGGWGMVGRGPAKPGPAPAAQPPLDLKSAWDQVYGDGFYTAHILGARLVAGGVLQGNKGSTLKLEMYRADQQRPDSQADIKGVAQDNNGNIYKVVF